MADPIKVKKMAGAKSIGKRIEALKGQILDSKDPRDIKALKGQLQTLRTQRNEITAQESKDGQKENIAVRAEESGDEGRARRVRSSMQLQGVGQEGTSTTQTADGEIAAVRVKKKKEDPNSPNRYQKGGKIKVNKKK